MSLIITARNEERRIASKIENTLELDYPADSLEIVVASDCSTDGTHAIVRTYADRGVQLVVTSARGGKEAAQRMGIAATSGEILVFSDVATRLDRHGLRMVARNFADPLVGCVSSVDRVLGADGQETGEGIYVQYEMLLRRLESSVGTVIGLSGSFFAARRDVCDRWITDLPSDFTTLLATVRHGLRGVSDPDSIGSYTALAEGGREYARKVRTVSRGISSILRHLDLLNPFRHPLVAWQLFSHKLCRWLVPYALLGLLAANVMLLSRSPFYVICGVAQVAIYGLAALGLWRGTPHSAVARILSFLVLSNLSILNAWFDVLRGRRVVSWEPSNR